MPTSSEVTRSTPAANLIRARAKVLAREDRELKIELIAMRRDAGLTQKQVADLIGVTQQAINKLERYDSDPKLSTLRRYANAVGALVEHRVTQDVGQSLS
jgi:DNA-binding XRE family transcriptional regulator